MNQRFELSFKNKEVRMWIYLAVPTFIVGAILIFYGDGYYHWIPYLLFLTIFYIWRFFYRRKRKNNMLHSKKQT
ncbi:hypothetical protein ACQCVP_18110 [Rossellomorea vietnamensis]|uniref:hypothetical protein n=1 Tax=Rossellomorea vietnamensis TaxID=218284 RepID=UPI003CEE0904